MLLHGQYPVFIVLLYCWLSVFPPGQTQRRQTRLILNMASWLKKRRRRGENSKDGNPPQKPDLTQHKRIANMNRSDLQKTARVTIFFNLTICCK